MQVSGWSALHFAAEKGWIDIVDILLDPEYGTDVLLRNQVRWNCDLQNSTSDT